MRERGGEMGSRMQICVIHINELVVVGGGRHVVSGPRGSGTPSSLCIPPPGSHPDPPPSSPGSPDPPPSLPGSLRAPGCSPAVTPRLLGAAPGQPWRGQPAGRCCSIPPDESCSESPVASNLPPRSSAGVAELPAGPNPPPPPQPFCGTRGTPKPPNCLERLCPGAAVPGSLGGGGERSALCPRTEPPHPIVPPGPPDALAPAAAALGMLRLIPGGAGGCSPGVPRAVPAQRGDNPGGMNQRRAGVTLAAPGEQEITLGRESRL